MFLSTADTGLIPFTCLPFCFRATQVEQARRFSLLRSSRNLSRSPSSQKSLRVTRVVESMHTLSTSTPKKLLGNSPKEAAERDEGFVRDKGKHSLGKVNETLSKP